MINLLLNNRYQIQAEIGRGGMGIVYRAFDTLLERDIAVKVLSTHELGSQGRARLLREAQAAARLNHPNIISIFDAGDANGLSFIVMELLDGDSLYEKKPEGLQATLEVLCQVCDALEHAHAHGIIHRDLKPENVIVTSKGIAKLTDFGLSRSISARASIEGGIVGTVYYLAPEQALKHEVDARADLYALGAMMYELLAGRLPFLADDPLGVISQHLNAPVVPPSTYNPAIPPALDTLIVRLLSKHPEERPSSAAEVRSILLQVIENPLLEEIIVQGDNGATSGCRHEFAPITRLALGRVVGRKRELSEIKALWREVISRRLDSVAHTHGVLVLTGETGVGKTPLLKEIRALAEVSGALVVQGNCYARTSAPYAPITQVLRILQPLPTDLPASVLAEAISHASSLESQPESTSNPRPPYNRSGAAPQIEQQRLFESVFQLFETLAAGQPIALIVEDVHWADAGSLLMLHYMARRSRAAALKLLIAVTYRPSELATNPALRTFLMDLNQERLSLSMDLLPFSREQTRELLATMFMEEIHDDFLDAIYGVTEGNLFFIEEICKALIEEGRLTCNASGWQLNGLSRAAGGAEIELPQSVRMALQMRVARLPEQSQDVLRMASLLGREFDFEVLNNSCDLDEDTLMDALEQAEKAQLIAEVAHKGKGSGAFFVFAHALIPTILRQDISSLRRRRIHRKLAAAIEDLHPDDLESLAFHYSQAGDIEKARHYNLLAGHRARKLYANQEAIDFYTEALRLTPDHAPHRFQILEARQQVYDLLAIRDLQRADIEAMIELGEESNDDNLRCDASLALAHYTLDTEHLLSREPSLQAVELARRMQDPIREARGLRCLGFGAWLRSDLHESLSALEQAVIRFRQAGLVSEAAECLHLLSLTTGLQGLGELAISQRYAEDAIRLSRQAGDRRQEAISLRRLAINSMNQRKYAEALQIAGQAILIHQELKDRSEESSALNMIGLTKLYVGQTEEGVQDLYRSLELARETVFSFGILATIENITWANYWRKGDLEGALEFIDQQRRESDIATNPFLARALSLQKVDTFLKLGQYEVALEVLESADDRSAVPLPALYQANVWIQMALAAAGAGDFQRAAEILKQIRELSRKFERPTEAARLLIVQAYIAWLENDRARLAEAAALADQAILLLRGTAWIYELNWHLITAARLSLALGKSAQALAQITEAYQTLSSFPLPDEGLLIIYSRSLRANGQVQEANAILETAYQRVTQAASQLKNLAYRQSFLERVCDHRDIVADWDRYRQ